MHLPRLIMSVLFISLLGCSDEELEPDNNQNQEYTEGLDDKTLANSKIINITNTNLDFLEHIKNDTIIYLSEFDIYVFDNLSINLNGVNNFTLNGMGATLRFNYNGKGIFVNNSSNIILKNFKIDNGGETTRSLAEEGRVQVQSSTNVSLDNLIIGKQKVAGGERYLQIQIIESTYCEVKNSTIYEAEGELINLRASSDCVVKNNTTHGGASGIATEGYIDQNGDEKYGYRNYIYQNNIYNCVAAMITINDRHTIVEENNIKSTRVENGIFKGGPGIRFGHYIYDSLLNMERFHLTAVNCKAIENNISNLESAFLNFKPVGIKIDATVLPSGPSSILIDGNKIENCMKGVQVSNIGGQTGCISSNEITPLQNAIELFSGDNSTPQDFKILKNEMILKNTVNGIKIWHSNAHIEGNYIFYSESINTSTVAIEVWHNTENEKVDIVDNVLRMRGGIGIRNMEESFPVRKSIISKNEISNSYYGIYLTNGMDNVINENSIEASLGNGIRLGNGFGQAFQRIFNTQIFDNDISSFSNGIYLLNTDGSRIRRNSLTYLGGTNSWAIWLSETNNTSWEINDNKLIGYINEHNTP